METKAARRSSQKRPMLIAAIAVAVGWFIGYRIPDGGMAAWLFWVFATVIGTAVIGAVVLRGPFWCACAWNLAVTGGCIQRVTDWRSAHGTVWPWSWSDVIPLLGAALLIAGFAAVLSHVRRLGDELFQPEGPSFRDRRTPLLLLGLLGVSYLAAMVTAVWYGTMPVSRSPYAWVLWVAVFLPPMHTICLIVAYLAWLGLQRTAGVRIRRVEAGIMVVCILGWSALLFWHACAMYEEWASIESFWGMQHVFT